MKKKLIRLTESDLHKLIGTSVKRIIKESFDDGNYDDEEGFDPSKEELDWELKQFQKAMQKQNGTYHAKSSDGNFQTGDKVIVHTKNMGDIEGVIEDFDTNIMTWEDTVDVKYFDEKRGEEMIMLSVPLTKIEKIS